MLFQNSILFQKLKKRSKEKKVFRKNLEPLWLHNQLISSSLTVYKHQECKKFQVAICSRLIEFMTHLAASLSRLNKGI